MRWFWAFLLISVGILYLGPQLGFWSVGAANSVWQLWPVLLVLFGLNLMVRRSKAEWVIMLLAFVLAGLFVYDVALRDDSRFIQDNRQKSEAPRESSINVDVPSGIERAFVEINTGAIEMDLGGHTDKLLQGKLTSTFAEPSLETQINGNNAKVKLSTTRVSKKLVFRDFKNYLNLKIGNIVPTEVKIDSGASDLNLDFSDIKLAGLSLNSGASSIDAKIGSNIESNARLSFEAGASDINISFPKGIGVKIESESGLAREEFEGFTKKNGFWENAEYASAEKKITIVLRTGASSVDVTSY